MRVLRDCLADAETQLLLQLAITCIGCSAHAYHRVLKVARTIAALTGLNAIGGVYIPEAIHHFQLDAALKSRRQLKPP